MPNMPGNGPITKSPVKSSVAIKTLESNQSHYIIFVFIGELTGPIKLFSEIRLCSRLHRRNLKLRRALNLGYNY
jgi:hypothetical protein